jgi:acetyl esterase/lipase
VSRDVLSRPARPPDRTLSYGPLPEHVVDVRLPLGDGPVPLVVVVHGGFWGAEWDRAHAGPQSAALADAGYVVATVEYRRVGMAGGGWPGTFDDLALVADVVPGLVAAETGRVAGPSAGPVRPVVVGHSAGGHLALWLASRHRLPSSAPWHRSSPTPLAGGVALAGMGDLVDAEECGLGDHAAGALLGGSPAQHPDRYDLASPQRWLPLGVSAVLVHGAVDEAVPLGCSRTYAQKATAAGDDVALVELDGVGHFELIDPLSTAWPTVLSAVGRLAAT